MEQKRTDGVAVGSGVPELPRNIASTCGQRTVIHSRCDILWKLSVAALLAEQVTAVLGGRHSSGFRRAITRT